MTEWPIRNLIIDMDGVLWRGDTPACGLAPFFATLRAVGMNYVLATNNATKTPEQYQDRLARFGVDIPAARILNSAQASAAYLRQQIPLGSSVFVVGEFGLQRAMQAQGFDLLQVDGLVGQDISAQAVIVGLTRELSYQQLANAALLIRRGALFVASNTDATIPSELGELPGAGSLVAFLERATGRNPVVIGKPGAALFLAALSLLDGTPQDTVMVGDRLNTDVVGAKALGLRAVLLLGGVSTTAEAETAAIRPDWIFSGLEELAAFIRGRATDEPL